RPGVVAVGGMWAAREMRARRGLAVADLGPLGAATMAEPGALARAIRGPLSLAQKPPRRGTRARPTRRPSALRTCSANAPNAGARLRGRAAPLISISGRTKSGPRPTTQSPYAPRRDPGRSRS